MLAAPDKFRGTATASEAAQAIAAAANRAGASCDAAPMADGGEGTLDALGGANRNSVVVGPGGGPVAAGWRLVGGVAVIEMARASGLALAGGASGNDPVNATTAGTGQLIAEAVRSGARRVIVAVGGSATTDGGLGAIRALPSQARMKGVDMLVACDVRTGFLDAAAVFGPQKGASPAQVALLRRRLVRLAQTYLDDYGVDVTTLAGAGAAGGLAGGLAARGAQLVHGFDLVADEIGLRGRIAGAGLVVTGEGRLDATSFEGKVVGGVARLAGLAEAPALAVVGVVGGAAGAAGAAKALSADFSAAADAGLEVIDLTERFGASRALADVAGCVQEAVFSSLAARTTGGPGRRAAASRGEARGRGREGRG